MTKPKKLIEVAMPVKEISAESVQDKYIHHGHISTLHIWWARRPLPICRATIFASLVPDPLDENCPEQFIEAVETLLGSECDAGNVYKPYDDIPHTAIVDKMEDNLRNRLMMFIGKFSDKYINNEKLGNKTPAKEQLHSFSLIKSNNKNNAAIIDKARKLIFVSHNAKPGISLSELLTDFQVLNDKIKKAEQKLYSCENRHISNDLVNQLEEEKNNAISNFLNKMPKVFDPFAGGGAIPLEAARLGCKSYGNDINPVAHIIQKGSCDLPQRYGKPITYTDEEFKNLYGELEYQNQLNAGQFFGGKINVSNRLSFDVEYYAKLILSELNNKIGDNYPSNENGKKPVAYIWARVGRCENPSCRAEVPLLRQFYLCKKKNKVVCLKPIIENKSISFELVNKSIENERWINRGNLTCPCCSSITSVKQLKKQFLDKTVKEKLIAKVYSTESGKEYQLPTSIDISSISNISEQSHIPQDKMHRNSAGGDTFGWGIDKWHQLFNKRQLDFVQSAVHTLREFNIPISDKKYNKAIKTYLALWLDRVISYSTSFGRWIPQNEQLTSLFGRQAIAMIFDYPEMMPFASSTSSALNQLDWIIRYLNEESSNSFSSFIQHAASGDREQFNKNEIDSCITDPPYYDAIAYADLSDFFYTWLKISLGKDYPLVLATPQTPKKNECTALRHHHDNDAKKAFIHFENMLKKIFGVIEYQTKDIVTIMFAHQSTRAWTTLCNSILGSRMNIESSWAIDSERDTRMVANSGKALQSSVTVGCKPSKKFGIGDYGDVKKEILKVIKNEIKSLYALGFRGADLLTACFGKAVSVFGQYESVEKADGSNVTVAELLEMTREAAFNAIVSDIDTDDLTKFYIGWLNLFSFSEAIHDDVRRISQIGLSVEINEIYNQNILLRKDEIGILGNMSTRINEDSRLGLRPVNNNDIDIAHRLMYLYDSSNAGRSELLDYVANKAPTSEASVWRVLNSLAELLPKSKNLKDQELAVGLLQNQENLIREAKNRQDADGVQTKLGFE